MRCAPTPITTTPAMACSQAVTALVPTAAALLRPTQTSASASTEIVCMSATTTPSRSASR